MKSSLIILAILLPICLSDLPGIKSHSYSSSQTYVSSYSSDGVNKPESHMAALKTEKYEDQEGDQVQMRGYAALANKDNDNPMRLREKAATNVEGERQILSSGRKESVLSKPEEDVRSLLIFSNL
jgi:hypothetical protein